ncbi:rhomboid-related protein 2 [Procambarus clarkii]|nr:rhomboid-related protein 2-like [Procambarus clarkii]XP_045581869.1 rhomboid-related protein 2-like [Procambarus clarkii]XP_045581870.1 rhomboid-related protein 2-like [Procambarus clarkii]
MARRSRIDKYEPINWHEIFQKIDSDGDGYILRSELKKYLLNTPVSEVPLSDDMVDSMLYHVDYNNDGYINLQEFYGLVNVPVDAGTRSIVQRTLVATAFSIAPRSQVSHGDRHYIAQYSCCPPPLLIPLLCTAEVGIFVYYAVTMGDIGPYSPIPWSSPLIYDPYRRLELWRFISYMFLHAGYVHLLSNVMVALFVGIPLEMVHRWWRLLILYVAGVLAGSLAASMFDPHSYLVGASGGCYALIAAHLANIIINWSEMPFNWARLLVLVTMMATDIGVFTYMTLTKADSRVSYVAHLAGFCAGLLVGMVTLRNLREHRWEIILKWTGLAVFLCLITAAIVIQIVFPDLVGLYPPMPKKLIVENITGVGM